MMRNVRMILIGLLSLLCVSFAIQFGLMIHEERLTWELCAKTPTFSCDFVPEHVVGAFHFVAFILLICIIFARKYYWSFAVALVYLAFDLYSLHLVKWTTWFDWGAAGAIVTSLLLVSFLLLIGRREPKLP